MTILFAMSVINTYKAAIDVFIKKFKQKLISQVPIHGIVNVHHHISVAALNAAGGKLGKNNWLYSTAPSPVIIGDSKYDCNNNSVVQDAIPICLGVCVVVIKALLS